MEIITDREAAAREVIALEKAALDKFFAGDVSGYLELWSKDDFSYFDANCKERIDRLEEIVAFFKKFVEGRMHADTYDFHASRVQFGADTAVLTYQLHADTNFIEMHYNVIEVFRRKADGWEVIHSTWDLITPFSPDVKRPKQQVAV